MEIKNQVMQCPNGYYYNSALHASCPICSGESADGSMPATGAPGAPMGNPYSSGGQGSFGKTEAPYSMGGGAQGNFQKTEAPYSMGGSGQGNFKRTESPDSGRDRQAPYQSSPFEPTMIGGEVSSGMTVTAPVVGWLVCVDGAMRGCDFRIHAGYNYIGREVGDIHITGDQQISRQNHAMVAYDEDEHIFYAGPSAGRNLVKVNGRTIFNAVELHNYDVMSIGTTKLMFVALCGEHFDWRKE